MNYIKKQIGLWGMFFDRDKMARMEDLHVRLKAKFDGVKDTLPMDAVIDIAEEAGICTAGEASELRAEFVDPRDGLALVYKLF